MLHQTRPFPNIEADHVVVVEKNETVNGKREVTIAHSSKGKGPHRTKVIIDEANANTAKIKDTDGVTYENNRERDTITKTGHVVRPERKK